LGLGDPLMRRRAALACLCGAGLPAAADGDRRRWAEAAATMKARALGWGDQPYGAVLVLDGRIVGEGPSRVVIDRDADAHAERVAIRDAQTRLGRSLLPGSILVSTSRPCAACERAAAAAQVALMLHGPEPTDAGPPLGLRPPARSPHG
jgi:tRNA(adenine34) deaminase